MSVRACMHACKWDTCLCVHRACVCMCCASVKCVYMNVSDVCTICAWGVLYILLCVCIHHYMSRAYNYDHVGACA